VRCAGDQASGGAAIDVFPTEPATNSDPFTSPLCDFDNVILTPHIGGSTQEAQENIGLEVAGKLTKYSDNGSTLSAVNFPEVSLPLRRSSSAAHPRKPSGRTDRAQPDLCRAGRQHCRAVSANVAQMGTWLLILKRMKMWRKALLQAMKAIPGTIRARLLY
jgi:D-3-phosphoglycerate dehydrogenase